MFDLSAVFWWTCQRKGFAFICSPIAAKVWKNCDDGSAYFQKIDTFVEISSVNELAEEVQRLKLQNNQVLIFLQYIFNTCISFISSAKTEPREFVWYFENECCLIKAFELWFLILNLPMYVWRICLNITWFPCMTLDSLSSRSMYCQEKLKGRKHRITDNDDMPLLPHCIIRFPNFELC